MQPTQKTIAAEAQQVRLDSNSKRILINKNSGIGGREQGGIKKIWNMLGHCSKRNRMGLKVAYTNFIRQKDPSSFVDLSEVLANPHGNFIDIRCRALNDKLFACFLFLNLQKSFTNTKKKKRNPRKIIQPEDITESCHTNSMPIDCSHFLSISMKFAWNIHWTPNNKPKNIIPIIQKSSQFFFLFVSFLFFSFYLIFFFETRVIRRFEFNYHLICNLTLEKTRAQRSFDAFAKI